MTNSELKKILSEGKWAVSWRKKGGQETSGVLTRSPDLIPEAHRPKGGDPGKRKISDIYVSAFCIRRGRWCNLRGDSVIATKESK